MEEKAILILEDGTTFEGVSIGAKGITTGEIAFNTGMSGYQEIFTDPSYYGQIVVMNTAHIGNYGVHDLEIESDSVKISGLVVKKFSSVASRVGPISTLQQYLEDNDIVGISDIDTRALVRHIRDKGAMNSIICSDDTDVSLLKAQLSQVPSMDGLELSSKVSTEEAYEVGSAEATHKISMLDLGTKNNIVRSLVDRGCRVKVFPMNSSFEDLMTYDPDGIMFSNGPGDPSALEIPIQTVAQAVDSGLPCFGICLGHQVIALSQGLKTRKMHHGHRGINHPVLNLITGKAEVTSQNHGFVIDEASVEDNTRVEVTHRHLNDDTVAGIRVKDRPVFSVQYHPEACPGPHDSRYLFDDFISIVREHKTDTVTEKS